MSVLKVLIVDDEAGIRSGIVRILQKLEVSFPFLEDNFSYELREAGSGELALEMIEQEGFDIVLLDNKLPGIQGIEVLEYLNKNKPGIGVMIITSYASLDLAIKATHNGAYNFVPKPFTPAELKTAMESMTKHLFLKRMTEKLQQEGKSIRYQFLSVLSHELKSPINAIEGYLRMMQDRQLGEDVSAYDHMLLRSLERIKGMRTLIMDLLDLTKMESGKKNRELRKLDLVELIRLSLDSFRPMAIQKNIRLELEVQLPEITYFGDAEELEIVFNNLISNAVKYNHQDGRVLCRIEQTDQNVEIRVEDTGIGMTEEEIARLFQDFVRIKNSKTREITGSGLGLSIVKKMLHEYYHAEVTVSSVPDQGSVFCVTLPLQLSK